MFKLKGFWGYYIAVKYHMFWVKNPKCNKLSWEVMKIYPLKIYEIRYWEFLFISYVTRKVCVLCETGPVCFCRFIDYMLKTNVSTGSAFHYHDYVYVYLLCKHGDMPILAVGFTFSSIFLFLLMNIFTKIEHVDVNLYTIGKGYVKFSKN